ncbi:hypothetical protein FGE12_20275 [Aggregicoccus sp. 17bor-14]|uniref:hypothetical protein n=1 Tax=Myxococcaceae TaxID=31 RepID=UPI00129CA46D|nr:MULTISPECIES: hypothetical protein [Myxococcaceae]MBF5044749.1 hypothetical protein [Simulacricoccus sp. 17bor-14]MRI90493.1 hypothetical protein [Aggregicoccus sp. 17bor-14]
MDELTCLACGEGTIRPISRAGRTMRYRQLERLELPGDLALPTCDACGELWLDAEATEAAQRALAAEYGRQLSLRAEQAVETLRSTLPQRDLERLIGVSAGLLSKIKNGKETSPTLTALLLLLASRPERVRELERLWKRPARSALRALEAEPLRVESAPVLFGAAPQPELAQSEPISTTSTLNWEALAA